MKYKTSTLHATLFLFLFGCLLLRPLAATAACLEIQINMLTPATCGNNDGSVTFELLIDSNTCTCDLPLSTYKYQINAEPAVDFNPQDPPVTVSGLAAGAYTLTVYLYEFGDPNHCDFTSRAFLISDQSLNISSSNIMSSACTSNTGAFTVTVSDGTAPFTVTANGNSMNIAQVNGSANFTNLAPNTYAVVVTDNQGCTGEISVEIEPAVQVPLTLSEATPVSCNGGNDGSIRVVNPTFSTPGYSYAINPNTSFNTGNHEFSGMAAGSYTITVTHTMSGCMASTTTAIPEPNPIDIQATPKQVSCTGLSDGEINVTVTGGNSGFQYEWSHGPTTEDLTGLAPGSYTLMVTDSKGCEATSTAIVITDDNDVAFQISYDSIVNSGDSPELSPFTNTSGYNFTWRVLEATNVTIAPSPNAQNSLSNGATILHTLTTHDARSLGGVVYEFQPVKISNPNCKAKADTVTVLVRPETDGEPFIPEIYTPNGDGQNDYWNLTMPPDVEIGKYTIFNRLGGQVFEADIDTFWDGNLCPDGPYIYVLRYTQNGVEKIVKGIVTIIRTAK